MSRASEMVTAWVTLGLTLPREGATGIWCHGHPGQVPPALNKHIKRDQTHTKRVQEVGAEAKQDRMKAGLERGHPGEK